MDFDKIDDVKRPKIKIIRLKPRKEMKSSPRTIKINKDILKRHLSMIKPQIECKLEEQPKRIMNKTLLNQFYKVS